MDCRGYMIEGYCTNIGRGSNKIAEAMATRMGLV